MTKTKKCHQGNADPANSGAVARSHATSAATLAENQNQQFESRPSREQSIDDFDMAIRELAYLKWEAAGFPAGDGFDFWLEAERELKANTSADGHTEQ